MISVFGLSLSNMFVVALTESIVAPLVGGALVFYLIDRIRNGRRRGSAFPILRRAGALYLATVLAAVGVSFAPFGGTGLWKFGTMLQTLLALVGGIGGDAIYALLRKHAHEIPERIA